MKKVGFSIIICGCFLLALNLVLHAYQNYVRGYSLKDTIFSPWYRHYYFLGPAFKPNSGGKTDNPWDFKINKYGFRGPEFDLKKDNDVFRIVCFGGSTSHAGDYPGKLAKLLEVERTAAGKKFEVINAAVPAWNTTQSLIHFIIRGIYLEPDLVIIYHAINDRTMKDYYWFTDLPEVEYETYGSFIRNHFILCNIIYNRINTIKHNVLKKIWLNRMANKIPERSHFKFEPLPLSHKDNTIFKKNIENFILLSQNRNIKVMLCPMALSFDENLSAKENLILAGLYYEELEYCVSRVKSYNNIVKNLAQKYNTIYLDIPNIIKPGKDNFRDTCHFVEKGAMLMAQAVKNKLKEVGIIR